MFAVACLLILLRLCVESQLTSTANFSSLMLIVNFTLKSPSILLDYYLAVSISKSFGTLKSCNCPILKSLFRESSESLDIYWALKINDICNCPKAVVFSARHNQLVEYDSKVSFCIMIGNLFYVISLVKQVEKFWRCCIGW